MAEVANPQGATLEAAAAKMLEAGVVPKDEEEKQEAAPEETPDEEQPAEVAPTEEESKPEQPEASDTVEIDPEESLFEVEIKDGGQLLKKEKLSLNELKNGYKRLQDYSRDMQEVARQREGVKDEIRKGIADQQKQYLQALETQQKLVWGLVAPELQNVNLDQLASDDPAEYVKVSNKLNRFNMTIQGIQAEQQKLAQQEREHLERVVLPKAAEELQRDIPNWGADLQRNISRNAMEKYGFTTEELSMVVDPRYIKVLHDAFQFNEGKKVSDTQKTIAQKKVVEKPKVLKPGTTQQAKKSEGDDFKRLQKSGRFEDAATVILGRLNRS
jgi:hypothetical protein